MGHLHIHLHEMKLVFEDAGAMSNLEQKVTFLRHICGIDFIVHSKKYSCGSPVNRTILNKNHKKLHRTSLPVWLKFAVSEAAMEELGFS